MKTKTARILALFALIALVAVPFIASADNATGIPYWATGGLISCTGNYLGTSANNLPPCQSLCNLIQTFANIIYFIITVCIFILAPIFFAIGGVMLLISGANPEMLSKGKSVFVSTAIGLAIVLCSYILVYTFVGIFNATTSNGNSIFGNISCNAQLPS